MLKVKIDFQFNVHVHRYENGMPVDKSLNSDISELPSTPVSLVKFVESRITDSLKQHRFSTAGNYRTALRSFLKFLQSDDVPLSDITPSCIASYERWLKSRMVSMGTLSCYMRSLRSLYNKAVEEKLVTDCKPFEKSFTGYPKTDKRSITSEDIHKLKELPIQKKNGLRMVRDLFLFCVFACGMPFVDLAFLRKSQISEDGYLTYQRRKTNQKIRVKLLPCAMEIIQRYQTSGSDYVFPVLTTENPEEAYKQYREKLCYYNKLLKELGQRAGLTHKLTSYVSRHSWASLAYEQATDVAVISKGLGHTSAHTTYIYIKGINDERLDEANKKIADSILKEKKKK